MSVLAKKIVYFLLCGLLTIIIIVAGFYLYKNRNAEIILPSNRINTEIVAFYQKDKRWSDDNLGDSEYKMSDSGCLTTCLASMLLMQDIPVTELTEINPKTLNEYFSKNNVYDREGNLDWIKAGEALKVEFIGCEAKEYKDDKIETLLNDKKYPIVCVKTENGNYHFVLIVGSDEENFLCMDPMNKNCEITSLSKFDNKIYSVRYCEK